MSMQKISKLSRARLVAPCCALSIVAADAGCSQKAAPTSSVDDSIQGGVADSSDLAVGMLLINGTSFCSGTLIAPDVVLTAGHCFGGNLRDACSSGAKAQFFTGPGAPEPVSNPTLPGNLARYDAATWAVHPGYDGNESQCPNTSQDVALVHLASPVYVVLPLSIASSPPNPGDSCQAVGYGWHEDDTFMQKRSASETVASIGNPFLAVTRGSGIADHGDSGGPLLCGGAIAGATSCHADGSGASHNTEYYTRTDTDAVTSWISGQIAQWNAGGGNCGGGGGGGSSGGGSGGGGGGGGNDQKCAAGSCPGYEGTCNSGYYCDPITSCWVLDSGQCGGGGGGGGGSCTCDGGVDSQGNSFVGSCGQTYCGSDNSNWECDSTGWIPLGGSC
jgi:hypothetical protein